jgi:hypothetical protein
MQTQGIPSPLRGIVPFLMENSQFSRRGGGSYRDQQLASTHSMCELRALYMESTIEAAMRSHFLKQTSRKAYQHVCHGRKSQPTKGFKHLGAAIPQPRIGRFGSQCESVKTIPTATLLDRIRRRKNTVGDLTEFVRISIPFGTGVTL